jgi:hypothetical protein
VTKIIINLSMESHLGIILHVYVACNLSTIVFLKRFLRVKALI